LITPLFMKGRVRNIMAEEMTPEMRPKTMTTFFI
jgi:hypothetical protein